MSSPALRAEIRDLVDAFVADLEVLVRRAALETVAEALGSAPPVEAPRRVAAGARAASAPSKSSKPSPKRSAAAAAEAPGRVRRSTEEIEATAERIVGHVEQHPGSRAEDIRAALGLAKNEWTLTVKRLNETGRLATKGEKRATVYFAKGAPRLGVVRRPGRGAAASEPTGGSNGNGG